MATTKTLDDHSGNQPALDVNPVVVDAQEVITQLESNGDGLSESEASSRLEKFGPNELKSEAPIPKWKVFLLQFNSPLIYLLLAAIAISLAAWALEGRQGLPIDAIVITIIVVVNAVFGYIQEGRAADAVAALASMTTSHSTVMRGGKRIVIESKDLVPGDILILSEGDEVGADARLLWVSSLRVAESSLTGESLPVDKNPDILPADITLGDRVNMVYKGTAVTQGSGVAVVTSTGMHTEMGSIAQMLSRSESEDTPLQKEIDQLGKYLGIGVIVIALIIMATVFFMRPNRNIDTFIDVLIMGVSLAVAAVPEGLPAILSVVLSIGVQQMAKQNAIVKNLSSVETLGSSSVIATDKTGTLTKNEMTILRVITSNGEAILEGVGYAPRGQVIGSDGPLIGDQLAEVELLLAGGAAANNAQLENGDDGWQIQGDPTDAAFIVADRKFDSNNLNTDEVADIVFDRTGEVPFTSERKLMSVTGHIFGDDAFMFTKGAPDVLLAKCTQLQRGKHAYKLTDDVHKEIEEDLHELASEGFRTLAVAYRDIEDDPGEEISEDWESDLVFVGLVAMIDPPRDAAKRSIKRAHDAGIRVMMITGDHPSTAKRIAVDLGIIPEDGAVLTGNDLDELTGEQFDEAISETSVYARVAPEHKMKIVHSLQDKGEIVAMTGDGVNDAPALKSADIGVAMGITGTEVSKQSAKMILVDDNFSTIVYAVEQGRKIFDNIRKFLRYLLSSNMGEVFTMFLGISLASVIGLYLVEPESGAHILQTPLLATQILWINLVTDSMPALAMGVDPAVDDVMKRKPRGINDQAISKGMWLQIIWIGLVMALVVLFVLDFYMPGGFVNSSHMVASTQEELKYAQTAAFTTLVLMQLINAFNARSTTSSAFKKMFDNKWLWLSVAGGLILQIIVVEVPVMQVAFGTASLSLQQWGVCIAASFTILIVEEIRKAIVRASLKE
ncbi:MAG TPA: cation-translocating P-type ATPase [Actinomyces sp.]|nr:cation-translocating P-type ATPase [Acidobacteriota bacterium]HHT40418.1 cation-translocating P-type ATPase [Actinomyces sp.]